MHKCQSLGNLFITVTELIYSQRIGLLFPSFIKSYEGKFNKIFKLCLYRPTFLLKPNPSSTIVRLPVHEISNLVSVKYIYERTSGFAPIPTFSTLILKNLFHKLCTSSYLKYTLVTNYPYCNKTQVRHNVDLPSKRFNSHFYLTSINDLLLSVPRFYLSCILRFIVPCLNVFIMNIART